MTKTEIRDEAIAKLSPEEREALAVDLWESIETDDGAVPEWHLDIVRQSLAAYEREPANTTSWEEVKESLRRDERA